MDYAHARVRLHFCKVRDWRGDFEMRERHSDGLADAAGRGRAGVARHPAGARMVRRGAGFEARPIAAEAAATLRPMSWLDDVKWDANGLVPAIAQEVGSNDVLMFAFMNRESLARTAELGEAVYWSRSRQRLWHKGEESGHVQKVREMRLDCDNDVVLLKVEQTGSRGRRADDRLPHRPASCFFRRYADGAWTTVEPVLKDRSASTNEHRAATTPWRGLPA